MTRYIVGLTGGIGSGKSSVAELFAARGVPVIDADKIARELSARGQTPYEEIVAEFGEEILNADATLNRTRLGEIVFAAPEKRRLLEGILHPAIHRVMNKRAKNLDSPYCLFEIPLLVESGRDWEVDRVLLVEAEEESRVARVKARNQLSEAHIRQVIAAQASAQARREAANDVIANSGSLADLEPQVEKLHQKYLALAGAGDG